MRSASATPPTAAILHIRRAAAFAQFVADFRDWLRGTRRAWSGSQSELRDWIRSRRFLM